MSAVVAIAGAIALADQIVKAVVLAQLTPGVPVSVIDGLVSLTLVMNPGLAFGLLSRLGAAWRWLAAGLSVVALVVLARVAIGLLKSPGSIDRVAIGLIFGGAVGNLVDRARFGAVVDFVDLSFRGYHWPAFNVADSAITVGVVLLAVRLLVRPPRAAPAERV